LLSTEEADGFVIPRPQEQGLYRNFINLNRLVRELMQIDGSKHPKKYHQQVNALLAGQKPFSDAFIFSHLRSNNDTDQHQ